MEVDWAAMAQQWVAMKEATEQTAAAYQQQQAMYSMNAGPPPPPPPLPPPPPAPDIPPGEGSPLQSSPPSDPPSVPLFATMKEDSNPPQIKPSDGSIQREFKGSSPMKCQDEVPSGIKTYGEDSNPSHGYGGEDSWGSWNFWSGNQWSGSEGVEWDGIQAPAQTFEYNHGAPTNMNAPALEGEVGVGPRGVKQGWHQPPPFVKKEDVPPFQPEGYQYFPKGFDVSMSHPGAPGTLGPPVDSLDAAKRRHLPAWILEGLEKMEKEKHKKEEKERMEKEKMEFLRRKQQEEEELLQERKAMEEKERQIQQDVNKEEEGEDEEEEMEDEEDRKDEDVGEKREEKESRLDLRRRRKSRFSSRSPEQNASSSLSDRGKVKEPPPLPLSLDPEEKIQIQMLIVRRLLTELLLEVTQTMMEEAAKEALNQGSSVNPTHKAQALAALKESLGLAAYESGSESNSEEEAEEEQRKEEDKVRSGEEKGEKKEGTEERRELRGEKLLTREETVLDKPDKRGKDDTKLIREKEKEKGKKEAKGKMSSSENMKMKIQVWALRIRWYMKRVNYFRHNECFMNNQKLFYQELGAKPIKMKIPDKAELEF
ncbi:unnamed protein product [Darwinula stevensoni]|uniref:Uncharacterized protein n=1 Tax=Darwinula stevensoni TaxID=69355 RepID=A0A7R8X9H0_9CRUS|nr:unnamed protein product [Darwinula stevensoni]CAG0889137.1 unnamed protein product [Darwinula stevensoni]